MCACMVAFFTVHSLVTVLEVSEHEQDFRRLLHLVFAQFFCFLQQPGGAMFAPAGQMGPGVMARPGGQMFMQQPQQQAVQQPVNPMQQQMQFQQVSGLNFGQRISA